MSRQWLPHLKLQESTRNSRHRAVYVLQRVKVWLWKRYTVLDSAHSTIRASSFSISPLKLISGSGRKSKTRIDSKFIPWQCSIWALCISRARSWLSVLPSQSSKVATNPRSLNQLSLSAAGKISNTLSFPLKLQAKMTKTVMRESHLKSKHSLHHALQLSWCQTMYGSTDSLNQSIYELQLLLEKKGGLGFWGDRKSDV